MRVNLYIFSIIVVYTWCVVKVILGSRLNDSEDDFYTKLAEGIIDNTMDESQRTRSRPYNLRDTTWGISLLDTHDGQVSSGVGATVVLFHKACHTHEYVIDR